MSFKSSNISSINFQLEDIFSCKSYSIFLSDLNDTQPISQAYYSTCVELIAKIHQFDDRVIFLPTIEAVSIIDVYAAVEDLRPHFGVSSSILKYRLLTFLCAHLQAEGIAVYENNRKNVQEKGKVFFQLQKICRDLQIIDEGSDNKESVISKVISRLTERLQEIPESLLLDPPKILARLQSDGRSVDELFNVKQIGTVSRVVELLYEDFHLRRQMLMKRLDVTIESFLCAKKAEGKEGDLVTIIKAQRDHLSKVPIKYTLKDALDAPISLLHESSKRVTDLGERSGGRLKIMEIMTGSVPDRGGRANEVRAKPLTAGRGGGGGGGGGRGGGRGGGGGGGGGGRGGGGGGRKGGDNSGGGMKVEDNSEGGKKRGGNSGGDRKEGENSLGDRKRGDNSGGGRKGRSRGGRGGGHEAVQEKEGTKMEVTEGNTSSVDVTGEGKRKRDDDRNA